MSEAKEIKTSIGGQALIEGIMMRGPRKTVMACRSSDGSITTEELKEHRLKDKYKIFGLPFIRGAVNLVESMILGYKALMLSAERSGMLDEVTEEKDSEDTESKEICEDKKGSTKDNVIMGVVGGLSMVLGVALAIALFIVLPTLAFNMINRIAGETLTYYRAIFEGVIKMIIFVCYLFIVSLMKEIRRVFMYHGAEHKTIFCYEKGLDLTVENVKKQKRFHPRCGTSFLILMLIVSILFFSCLSLIPGLSSSAVLWICLKIIMLPVICGLGYELIKICGRHDNTFTRIISAPGLWIQRITTKEPDDSMIEVAIKSLEAVIPEGGEDIL